MTALSGIDLRAIHRARELATLDGDGIRARFGQDDDGRGGLARALGAAQVRLAELADIAERLVGEDQAADNARRLDRIRVVLAGFDWETGDRQYALERIERIVMEGETGAS